MANQESSGRLAYKVKSPYLAFLLRCWQEETNGESMWRFTLVKLGDKDKKLGFKCLEDVTAYIRMELALDDKANSGGG